MFHGTSLAGIVGIATNGAVLRTKNAEQFGVGFYGSPTGQGNRVGMMMALESQVCTYTCMCIWTHTNTQTRTHRQTDTHSHTHTGTHTDTHTRTRAHTHVHTHTHTHNHTHTRTQIHAHSHAHSHKHPPPPLSTHTHNLFVCFDLHTSVFESRCIRFAAHTSVQGVVRQTGEAQGWRQ